MELASPQTDLSTSMTIEHIDTPDLTLVRELWCELENRAPSNVFLSWFWIGTWLEVFVTDFILVVAKSEHGVPIGLGIIVKTPSSSHLPGFEDYHLHRTGQRDLDQIWIEYNDYLLDAELSDQLRPLLNQYVMDNVVKRGGFSIGVSKQEVLAHSGLSKHSQRTIWSTMAYRVNLHRYQSFSEYEKQTLSKNARYQIRRSKKRYQVMGGVKFTHYSAEQVDQFFKDCAPYHLERWGKSSGFNNPKFLDFHHRLAMKGVPQGIVQLVKVSAGEHHLGYIYNFHFNGCAYFYLSAFDYTFTDKHLKPGLVTHHMLIEAAQKSGFEYYDFMGGELQYKRTLSDEEMSLEMRVYRNINFANSIKLAIDHAAVLRDRLTQSSPPTQSRKKKN
ncbi:GNAT family N-acetyltransferase [Vibrio ulleungensis]|uniref:GNAT family N-acetyltransferase n=1 Tax=Vibrio ulleungensis TaxID=2807619 RepID=A0ABS2HGA6_9VIBR|nr:GNAT family N-acetyltransferase [Vibrio ulleungensis]MBM7035168.1 GNAT family N-acetyltransferase [Vibrio ulleungensis]